MKSSPCSTSVWRFGKSSGTPIIASHAEVESPLNAGPPLKVPNHNREVSMCQAVEQAHSVMVLVAGLAQSRAVPVAEKAHKRPRPEQVCHTELSYSNNFEENLWTLSAVSPYSHVNQCAFPCDLLI